MASSKTGAGLPTAAGPKKMEANLCENCYEIFFSKKLYDKHITQCTEKRPAKNIKAEAAANNTLSRCKLCQRIFLGSQNLAAHTRKEHSKTVEVVKKAIHPCTICKKIFMNKELMEEHHKTHSNDSPKVVVEKPKEAFVSTAVPNPDLMGSSKKFITREGPIQHSSVSHKTSNKAGIADKRLAERTMLEKPGDISRDLLMPLLAGDDPEPSLGAPDLPESTLTAGPSPETNPSLTAERNEVALRDTALNGKSAGGKSGEDKNASEAGAKAAGGISSADGVASDPATIARANSSALFFACGSCSLMFSDKQVLIKHLVEKHPRELSKQASPAETPDSAAGPTYACAICDAKYSQLEQMRQHIASAHSGGRSASPATARPDTVWSTKECVECPALYRPSVRLRDVFLNLPEWTAHFYGRHQEVPRPQPVKRLELQPCHRCGIVFVNKATRLHHNAIAHAGKDPELALKQRQADAAQAPPTPTAAVSPRSMSAKARSRVIVDSLMRASLVIRNAPTVTMDRAAAQRAQRKVFALRSQSPRVTNVVFKCSKCGGMFPDDPSFERHAREAHAAGRPGGGGGGGPASPRPADPPPNTGSTDWDVLEQRECADCSKLMESCPRSFALFVRRDVWERHVAEVHATGRWRCTGETLRLRPCPRCPRLFMHPDTLEAHVAKLHGAMLGPVSQADLDACRPAATLECSRCQQLVQNADGIRFLDGAAWQKHFDGEHKELLLCDGKAGDWTLYPCVKCGRFFFSESDLPTHEARQAYMHMPLPLNAKVKTLKRGRKAEDVTEIMYQCANEECAFTSREHDEMVSHCQQCREDRPAPVGETVLYKTLMVKKAPPRKRLRLSQPHSNPSNRRVESLKKKLSGAADADGSSAETSNAVSQLLQVELNTPAVLELDPVTSRPRSVHPLVHAEDVPEAAAEEETVAYDGDGDEETDGAAAPETAGGGDPGAGDVLRQALEGRTASTRMDFACSICSLRGASRQEIVQHIRRAHRDGTEAGQPTVVGRMSAEQRRHQVNNYTQAYLCLECKQMAEPCERTRDLFFEKSAWLHHLATTHEPQSFSELDRLDLHECAVCERLFLSAVSVKRHAKFHHEEGHEQRVYLTPAQKRAEIERNAKHKFSCVEEGCDFKYHRVTRLRSHLIRVHNFDLKVREVVFATEDEFQDWKKTLELSTSAYFTLRSNIKAKRKEGNFNVRYFSCSRVMNHLPSYKDGGKKRQLPWQVDLLKADMVWRCPAFMKAEVDVERPSAGISVQFCPNHYGHDMDPSFGRLSDEDEAEIGGMLRAGLSIPDVLKRMREEGRAEGRRSRKLRVTEAEINRIFEKYMGMKPPKAKRFDPLVGKAVSRARAAAASAAAVDDSGEEEWIAESDGEGGDGEEGEEDVLEGSQEDAWDAAGGQKDSWQRLCGEDGCRFTTTSVGYLRCHLRQRHGFVMHIDSAGFPAMKDFSKWKRNLEKRTCAKYKCYKTVAPDDPDDPVVTSYYTCHRSGLNSLRRAAAQSPSPRQLVLCTGYMKVRSDTSTGEVACEYCASHYGHDARLVTSRPRDRLAVEFEETQEAQEAQEEAEEAVSPARRYSYVPELPASAAASPGRPRRGRPPKRRPPAPRRSRGGKRRRWEELDEEEEEDEDEDFVSD